jgi:CRP-like cAMP-binding protein
MAKKKSKATLPFDAGVYLETAGMKRKIVQYRKGQAVFSQGDKSEAVLYLQAGTVKITVSSSAGKEAVIALLGPGDFFGEGGISWPRDYTELTGTVRIENGPKGQPTYARSAKKFCAISALVSQNVQNWTPRYS